jgi:hypothetical protein
MKSIKMKKLFTCYCPAIAMHYRVQPPQGEFAGGISKLAHDGKSSCKHCYSGLFADIKYHRAVILSRKDTAELNLFNFFDNSATYTYRNAFILTYSTKTTRTYTTSTIPKVSGKFTKDIFVSKGNNRVRRLIWQ